MPLIFFPLFGGWGVLGPFVWVLFLGWGCVPPCFLGYFPLVKMVCFFPWLGYFFLFCFEIGGVPPPLVGKFFPSPLFCWEVNFLSFLWG